MYIVTITQQQSIFSRDRNIAHMYSMKICIMYYITRIHFNMAEFGENTTAQCIHICEYVCTYTIAHYIVLNHKYFFHVKKQYRSNCKYFSHDKICNTVPCSACMYVGERVGVPATTV